MSKTIEALVLIYQEDTPALEENKTIHIDLDKVETVDPSGSITADTFISVLYANGSYAAPYWNSNTAENLGLVQKFDEFFLDDDQFNLAKTVLIEMQKAIGDAADVGCWDDCSILEYYKKMADINEISDLCNVKCFLTLDQLRKQLVAKGWVAGDDVLLTIGVCFVNPRPDVPDIQVNIRYLIEGNSGDNQPLDPNPSDNLIDNLLPNV